MLKSFLAVLAVCLLFIPVTFAAEKINLNTASMEELQMLSGVGPSTAAAIIDYRDNNNGFISVEELMEVKGIGDKTLEKLADQLSVTDE